MVHLSLYRILTKLAVFYRLIGVVFLILVCNSYSGEAFAKNELWNRCVGADIDARIVSCSQFIARGKRENKSNQIAAYISRASGYRANGDYDRALADLDKALRLDPKSAPALLERASIYDVKSEFDRAIADYDTVLKLDKDSLAVRSGRARAYRGKGEFDKALADFNEAVRLDPNLASTHVDRGAIYQAQGDFDRAIVDYDRAIQIDPKDANAFLGRANGYRGKHDLERAKQDLESALRLAPQLTAAKDILHEVNGLIAQSATPPTAATPTAPSVPVLAPAIIVNFAGGSGARRVARIICDTPHKLPRGNRSTNPDFPGPTNMSVPPTAISPRSVGYRRTTPAKKRNPVLRDCLKQRPRRV